MRRERARTQPMRVLSAHILAMPDEDSRRFFASMRNLVRLGSFVNLNIVNHEANVLVDVRINKITDVAKV